jgi:hypothetical protein
MSTAACTRLAADPIAPHAVTTTPRSCIEQLAAGWINPPDLCPACTRGFMSALDFLAEPVTLRWHENFVSRASGSREGADR